MLKRFVPPPKMIYTMLHDSDDYFVLMNFSIYTKRDIFAKYTDCHSNLEMENVENLRMGFANKINLSCSTCEWENSFFTSRNCSENGLKQGRKHFDDVNVRSVIAFREIGEGHEAIVNYARCMNIRAISECLFRNINEDLFIAYEKAATKCMKTVSSEIKDAANEVDKHESGLTMCRVSLDGSSWQKRGHASLNGA